jgi:hypothetical protein
MGLLVAGITGGASLIDTARITSLKREVDDHIRDVFTFYSRVGRIPGDLDNSGIIGYSTGAQSYTNLSFPTPYVLAVNSVSGPFIDLYLQGISSFKPNHESTAITTAVTRDNVVNTMAVNGVIPFMKVYKDFVSVHRYGTLAFVSDNKKSMMMNMFLIPTNSEAVNKKIVDIAKKIDLKFDDGIPAVGNINAMCYPDTTTVQYSGANTCPEMFFKFDLR